MLSIVMIEHSDQNQLKRKGLCLFLLPDKSPSLRTERAGAQGKNLQARTEAENMEESYILAYFWRLAWVNILCNTGPPAQRTTTYSGVGSPLSISSEESDPQSCLQDNLMETILQLRFLLPR